jgi:hypothetical protein
LICNVGYGFTGLTVCLGVDASKDSDAPAKDEHVAKGVWHIFVVRLNVQLLLSVNGQCDMSKVYMGNSCYCQFVVHPLFYVCVLDVFI